MTDDKRLEYQLHDIWNAVEHVTDCADEAKRAAEQGNYRRVLEMLRECERNAGLVEMHFRDALTIAERVAG